MASTSYTPTPSEVRRLRAARLSFEPPSFSLGIDIETIGPIPSFDERPDTSVRHAEGEKRNRKPSEQRVVQIDNEESGKDGLRFEAPSFSLGIDIETIRPTPSFDECNEATLRNGEVEEKSWKPLQQRDVQIDNKESGEDGFPSRREQQIEQRRFKRLKRGPSSVRKEPLKGARDLFRNENVSGGGSSKDWGGCSSQLRKEPLPFAKDSGNQLPENDNTGDMKSCSFRQDCVGAGHDDGVLSSGSDLNGGLNRLKRGPTSVSGEAAQSSRDSFCSTDFPKNRMQRGCDSSGGGTSYNGTPLPTLDDFRSRTSEKVEAPFNDEVDEIEEFSDDEFFGSGSRSQKDRRSLRPQMLGAAPILISSSPETLEKPILHIPGVDSQPRVPKAPFKFPHPTTAERPILRPTNEEDTFLLDDFQSGSDWWRRTKPDLSRPGQTPRPLESSISASQRGPDSVGNPPGTSQLDSSRESNLKSFYTETPLRFDTVGPSQAFCDADADADQTEESRILAFLRQRFPHYKPVDALLVDGGLDNEPVFIDYRKQFADGRGTAQPHSENTGAGSRWPAVRSISGAFTASPPSASVPQRNGGQKRGAAKSQPKRQRPVKGSSSATGNARAGKRGAGGPAEGKWRTVNGSRVYIVGGNRMTGRHAYAAYKGRGNSSKKKSRKRPTTKAKK